MLVCLVVLPVCLLVRMLCACRVCLLRNEIPTVVVVVM